MQILDGKRKWAAKGVGEGGALGKIAGNISILYLDVDQGLQ